MGERLHPPAKDVSHGATLSSLLEDFSRYHCSPANRVCHYFGLPAISIAVLGGFGRVSWDLSYPAPAGELDMGLCLLLLSFLIDAVINWRLALAVLVVGYLTYLVGMALPYWALLVLFVGGWIAQLIGHGVFEGHAPAFTKNLVHLFIGPRWLVHQALSSIQGKS